VLGVVDLILALPATSVEAERGFSQMKLVKTDWRSCLNDKHLSDLLLVLLEAPDIDQFDPTPAMHLWMQGGHRRPTFMDEEPAEPEEPQDGEGPFETAEMRREAEIKAVAMLKQLMLERERDLED
jgi:hypothetical protein